jgi:Fe-S cluster assembly protein SufD
MAVRTTTRTFVEGFDRVEPELGRRAPRWLGEARRAALARLAERGLPTTRDEEWRYTSLAPIEETAFDVAPAAPARLSPAAIAPHLVGGPDWHRLVFVNGRHAPELSSAGTPPDGAQLGSLAEALGRNGGAPAPHVLSAEGELEDAWTALNAAFWADGALVRVPAGVVVAAPIHLLFLATGGEPAPATHPRSVIALDRDSRATVVESYATVGGGTYLTNAVTRILVADGARLDHHRIELESGQAFHVGRTHASLGRDSHLGSSSILFGGRIARHDVRVRLGAEGAECALHGLYVIGGRQHVDINTVVDHARPHGRSRQLYKGVLDGRARGVFSGRVIVRPDAQKTDAHQANKNLLLSDGVEVDSKPQLEIFADDVKCSHGAADGQLAADAIFYLKSRGLGEAQARALLTYGFASEVLGRIGPEALRARLDALLTARLSGGRVTEDSP